MVDVYNYNNYRGKSKLTDDQISVLSTEVKTLISKWINPLLKRNVEIGFILQECERIFRNRFRFYRTYRYQDFVWSKLKDRIIPISSYPKWTRVLSRRNWDTCVLVHRICKSKNVTLNIGDDHIIPFVFDLTKKCRFVDYGELG